MKLAFHWFGHIQVDKNAHILIQESRWYVVHVSKDEGLDTNGSARTQDRSLRLHV